MVQSLNATQKLNKSGRRATSAKKNAIREKKSGRSSQLAQHSKEKVANFAINYNVGHKSNKNIHLKESLQPGHLGDMRKTEVYSSELYQTNHDQVPRSIPQFKYPSYKQLSKYEK